jgi:AraC family transcriptional regulator
MHLLRFTFSSKAHNFKRALDYIETHLSEVLSLEKLAVCEQLTLYHFAHAFKKVIEQSPHQYIIGQRVKRAQHLLRTTQLSLAQIATEVGFANQSHLNRHFKSIVGITLKQYAR